MVSEDLHQAGNDTDGIRGGAALGGALFRLVEHEVGGERLDATVTPTDYCRGPWSLNTLHGGPVVGLLAWGCEQVAPPAMTCSRLTIEMLRPVPLDELNVTAHVVKPGRRTVVVDSALQHGQDVVARAHSMWLAHEPEGVGGLQTASPPERPTTADDPRRHADFEYPTPGFNCDTAELRYVRGSHEEEGPGTSWLRLVSPLLEGHENSPFVMAATVSDLAAAVGWEPSPAGGNYINPDVTLQLHRMPEGQWIAMDAAAEQSGNGVALMAATMFDQQGAIGRVLQSLVETPVQLVAQTPDTTSPR